MNRGVQWLYYDTWSDEYRDPLFHLRPGDIIAPASGEHEEFEVIRINADGSADAWSLLNQQIVSVINMVNWKRKMEEL